MAIWAKLQWLRILRQKSAVLPNQILVTSLIINDTTACCSEFKTSFPSIKSEHSPLSRSQLYRNRAWQPATVPFVAMTNETTFCVVTYKRQKKKAILAAEWSSARIGDRVFPVKPCQRSISGSRCRKSRLCRCNRPRSTPSRKSCCCLADAADINFYFSKTTKLQR